MEELRDYLKKAGRLWLSGFGEACCLHRVFFFCRRSRTLSIRTGQCFLLNGLIFLGSIFILNMVIIPTLWWLLPDQCRQFGLQGSCAGKEIIKFYPFLRYILIKLFYIFWFIPLYILSFVLSTIWYNDIAKHAFVSMVKHGATTMETSDLVELSNTERPVHTEKPAGVGGVIIGISEQVYSLFLLGIFFIEVYATGYIPYVGKAINFLLLSWMYAYYCFEYKWNFVDLGLEKRLKFFESNWAFFAGFGSPCVMASFFLSTLLSYGVMAILYPLFVLTAMGTQAEQVIDSQRRSWGGGGPGQLPIFYVSNTVAMRVLQFFTEAADKKL